MPDILTQEEIDALLVSVTGTNRMFEKPALPYATGGVTAKHEKKRLKVYDFRRPDKFSKDHIRTLQMMHETFARLTTTSLSAQLSTMVSVHVVSVDQLSYEEFNRSIPSPTTMGIINMDPLKGSAVLEIDPSITFAMIDRLFGGKGNTMKTNRELSDIEIAVIEGIIVRILGNLRESWANSIDLRPRLGNIETNPQFAQIVPYNNMVMLTTFDIRIGDVEGMMNFCIPHMTIEPVMAKLSSQFWYSSIRRGVSAESVSLMRNRISDIPVEVVVRLGETELNIGEISSLRQGDVIRLNDLTSSGASVLIGDSVKYRGNAGLAGKKKALQVSKVIESISDDNLKDILSVDEI